MTIPGLVVVAVLLCSLVRLRTMRPEPNIPSPLDAEEGHSGIREIRCEPVVFAIDSDGYVYEGKHSVGVLSDSVALRVAISKALERSTAQLAYTTGMDLNVEVPRRCASEVYLKTEGQTNDGNMLALIGELRKAGINPTWLNIRRKLQTRAF